MTTPPGPWRFAHRFWTSCLALTAGTVLLTLAAELLAHIWWLPLTGVIITGLIWWWRRRSQY